MTRSQKIWKKGGKELSIISYITTVTNVNYFTLVNDLVVKNPKKELGIISFIVMVTNVNSFTFVNDSW